MRMKLSSEEAQDYTQAQDFKRIQNFQQIIHVSSTVLSITSLYWIKNYVLWLLMMFVLFLFFLNYLNHSGICTVIIIWCVYIFTIWAIPYTWERGKSPNSYFDPTSII